MKKTHVCTVTLLVCISFFSFVLSNGQNCVPILTWVYPIMFLWIFRKYKMSKAILIVNVLYTIGFIIQWNNVLNMGLGVSIAIAVLFSILKIIPYIFYQYIKQNNQSFRVTVVFPIFMVAIEYIVYLINPILAGLSDAYTQYENLTLISITTIVGVYGITFIMGWTASVIDWMVENKGKWKQIKKGVTIFMIFICIFLLYGNIFNNSFYNNDKLIRVASITVPVKEILEGDSDVSKVFYSNKFNEQNLKHAREKLTKIHDELLEKTKYEALAGSKIVFWSELNGAVMKQDEEKLISKASLLAKEQAMYLILSLLVKTPFEKYKENKVIAINPNGEIVSEYYKSGLSIGELCIKGDGVIRAFDTEYGRIAPFICSDMAFSDMVRQAGKNQVDIIVIPASDWKEMSPIAIKTAIIRGVENGCSMIRQTNMGISISADYHGNIYSMNNYYVSENLTMVTNIPSNWRFTVYPFIGNILPWICIIYILAIGILHVYASIKRGKVYCSK